MHALSRRQLLVLLFLTLTWGVNWPVMKLGITGYPPLTFRAISAVLGLPVLAGLLLALKMPFRIPRHRWAELLLITATNMLIWNVCMIVALRSLSSGRAAILAYTMPIFSALLGALVFSAAPLPARGWLGVGAAAVGVLLLLWHELTQLAGQPVGVLLMLFGAATWALGTQQLRRTRIEAHALTLTFWMTAITTAALVLLACSIESQQWTMPTAAIAGAIAYNAVLIFGLSQSAWIFLAKGLPPVASTLSVMMIPVLGVFSGAAWLGELVHWQDWTAVVLMSTAIASVLWPTLPERRWPPVSSAPMGREE